MGRIRSIRPDFFMDEETAVLHPDAQLLLLGLATLADRDGRLEDRPVRIKASLFPYRDVDVAAHLAALEDAGQVVRYESDGVRCISLVHFLRDQKPHPKETSHGLPRPPVKSRGVSRQGADVSGRVPMVVGCGSGNGCGSTSSAPAHAVSDSVDELPDATDDAQPVTERMATTISHMPEAKQEDLLPRLPEKAKERPEDLQALWNAEAHPNLPRWKELTEKRRRQATTRLRERPLSEWREVIRRINASAFLRGEEAGSTWRASPDWLLQPDAAVKVLEGKYSKPGEHASSATISKPVTFKVL